jgi:curved DNA-binding protein CbpA
MTGSDVEAFSRLADLVRLLHDDLDSLSYYNLLGIPPDADDETIRQAYQGRSLWLHPDRHLQTAEPEMRVRIGAVYRRVAEAYRVLGRPTERAAYDALLARGEVRYSAEAAEALPPGAIRTSTSSTSPPGSPGAAAPGQERIQSVQARQLYDLSKVSLRSMEFGRAVMLLEQAVGVEPKSRKLKDALEEARRLKKMYGG